MKLGAPVCVEVREFRGTEEIGEGVSELFQSDASEAWSTRPTAWRRSLRRGILPSSLAAACRAASIGLSTAS